MVVVWLNLLTSTPRLFLAVRQMASERQSDKAVSDMEVRMKQRYVTEFLHVEKMAPTDIHWLLLSFSEDQTDDVSTVRWWMLHFSSGESDNGSPPLMQIFMNVACSLFFNADESV